MRTTFLLQLYFLCLCLPAAAQDFNTNLVDGARAQVGVTLGYDGSYRRLDYPGGDVPLVTGVCTDVIIRAYRTQGIDLQQLVHEDMKKNFAAYPSKRIWGLTRPDPSIDHRRVPNLQTFFQRHGLSLLSERREVNPVPGDLLTWRLPSGLPHIGLVSSKRIAGRHLVIHNIGSGTKEEDVIGQFHLTGWYRYNPTSANR